jgi:hypothetical protein
VTGLVGDKYLAELVDMNGNVLLRENFISVSEFTTRRVELSDIAPGAYFMRVTNSEESLIQRLVVVK